MSIIKRNELTLLRNKYLPAVYKQYVRITERLNRISERVDEAEGDIWLTEQQQRRLLREMYRDWKRMRDAQLALREYLRDIFNRLEETLP